MRKMGKYAVFYLDLLNQIVLKIKKPFTDIKYEDLIPFLREWQIKYGKSTMHGAS